MMRNTAEPRTRLLDSIIFKCEACYPNQEFDPDSLDVWHKALGSFDLEDISAAFTIHVEQSNFLPTIHNIISIIEKNKGSVISIEARAQQQWRVVMQAVRKFGVRNVPVFSDPVTANLIKTQFRWSYLCSIEEHKENWEQRRWCEAFMLAAEIHKDLVQIEIPNNVMSFLVSKITDKPEIEGFYEEAAEIPPEVFKSLREKVKKRAAVDAAELTGTNISIGVRIKVLQDQAAKLVKSEQKPQKFDK